MQIWSFTFLTVIIYLYMFHFSHCIMVVSFFMDVEPESICLMSSQGLFVFLQTFWSLVERYFGVLMSRLVSGMYCYLLVIFTIF